MTAINYRGREVTFHRPADAEESVRVGRGVADVARRWFRANAAAIAPTGCKLKLKEARYVGTAQESWSDDTYTTIPFEGVVTNASRENVSALFHASANGFSRDAWIDEDARHVVVYEYHGIGD